MELKMKICHCALPSLTGNTDCCKECSNIVYGEESGYAAYKDTLTPIRLPAKVNYHIYEFSRQDILNLKRELLQDLVDNVIELTPSMILRISNIFDDFVK